ncbi:hypothetical protein Sjap_021908 [Stephania japonica]|uniref:Uncharacterized protein n=1 Tax=Stephania japonica TaxID=461633 RepID=A0AAP0EMU8_9MAGN
MRAPVRSSGRAITPPPPSGMLRKGAPSAQAPGGASAGWPGRGGLMVSPPLATTTAEVVASLAVVPWWHRHPSWGVLLLLPSPTKPQRKLEKNMDYLLIGMARIKRTKEAKKTMEVEKTKRRAIRRLQRKATMLDWQRHPKREFGAPSAPDVVSGAMETNSSRHYLKRDISLSLCFGNRKGSRLKRRRGA